MRCKGEKLGNVGREIGEIRGRDHLVTNPKTAKNARPPNKDQAVHRSKNQKSETYATPVIARRPLSDYPWRVDEAISTGKRA